MSKILKREDIIVEGEPGKHFDIERLENDIKEISNKDAEGRIKVLYKMRPTAIFKPIKVGHFSPSEKPEEIFIEGKHPHINMNIHIDDAHDYYISNAEGIEPVCLSEYIVEYRHYHYRYYDHTRGEDSILIKPGDMVKLTAVDNYRELHNVGCIVGSCSTNTIMLAVADPKLIRATNSRRYDGDVVTKIMLKADIMGDENEVKEFKMEKID